MYRKHYTCYSHYFILYILIQLSVFKVHIFIYKLLMKIETYVWNRKFLYTSRIFKILWNLKLDTFVDKLNGLGFIWKWKWVNSSCIILTKSHVWPFDKLRNVFKGGETNIFKSAYIYDDGGWYFAHFVSKTCIIDHTGILFHYLNVHYCLLCVFFHNCIFSYSSLFGEGRNQTIVFNTVRYQSWCIQWRFKY